MDERPITPPSARRRAAPIRNVLIALLVSFALGAGAAWYFLRDNAGLPDPAALLSDGADAGRADSAGANAGAAAPAASRLSPSYGVLPDGPLDQRVAAMEQRLARLDLQAQAAAGNAGRAEGLLIVFASRRALDRGTPLGYLEDQLRLRFGDAQPNAVRTVIRAGRNPLTMDRLLARLEAIGAEAAAAPVEEGFFDRLQREMGQIFVIRREGTPSPAPERRLERARLYLESGRTEAAVAEVRMLPNAARAAQWLSDAERFANVQRALDLLETTAILEPRALRGGDGARIEQPSPVLEQPETADNPAG